MTYYYDATDSAVHDDAEAFYADRDHPDLQDCEDVRQCASPPEGATLVEESGQGESGEHGYVAWEYDAFAEEHWQTRVSEIKAGNADDILAEIIEQTTSETVREAAQERRDDLR